MDLSLWVTILYLQAVSESHGNNAKVYSGN